jgi:hypothetical protein
MLDRNRDFEKLKVCWFLHSTAIPTNLVPTNVDWKRQLLSTSRQKQRETCSVKIINIDKLVVCTAEVDQGSVVHVPW